MLPLLRPCPNRVAGSGVNRELFVVAPVVLHLVPHCDAGGSAAAAAPVASLRDAYYTHSPPPFFIAVDSGRRPLVATPLLIELYRFLGRVIGMAVRSRVQLPFLLAPAFWKALVCEPATLHDLAAVDTAAVALLTQLKRSRDACAEYGDAIDAHDAVPGFEDLVWTTTLSDGCEVELVPGGSKVPVRLMDVDVYCERVLAARLGEAEPAMRAVVEGFISVVPAAVLPLMTARELELMVCGVGDVDVDLLQKNTEYDEDGTCMLSCVGVNCLPPCSSSPCAPHPLQLSTVLLLPTSLPQNVVSVNVTSLGV
jgi:hypothetical protein